MTLAVTADPPARRPEKRLILLRHGRTAFNAGGRFQGQLDVPLDDRGREQAHAAAALLPAVDRVLCSDLERAAETAQIVGDRFGLRPEPDPRLREIYLGSWQGLTAAEAEAAHPQEFAAWQAGEQVRRGGGETYPEVAARALELVAPAMSQLPETATLLVVTHGGTARALVCALLELDPADWWRIGPLANCSWTTLARQPAGMRLLSHGRLAPE